MSKLLKRLNDNQNKVADTNGIMKLQAWDYGVAQDLTGKKITATVANASGFLFDIDLVSNGTEIDLDFKNERLQKLTPDTYFIEIKVTDKDGDVSVFPTEGYATFTINKNLHATEGALVPQITFDTVLADVKTAMDEKIADYVKTIAKGDKGDTGVVDTTADYTWTGTNTFNKKIIAPAGVQGNADTATKLATARTINGTNFDGTADINVNAANDSNLVHTTGTETVGDDKKFTGNASFTKLIDGALKTRQATFTDFNEVARVITDYAGIWYVTDTAIKNDPISNLGGLYWYQVTITPAYGNNTGNIEIFTVDGKEYISGVDAGALGGWYQVANNDNVLHKTGNETIAGDKTFTSNTTLATTTLLAGNYGLRVTPSGFQKTTDGKTWVSANI